MEEIKYLSTDAKTVEALLEVEKFYGNIWDCNCGNGSVSKVLVKHEYNVLSTAAEDFGYKGQTDELVDFLECQLPEEFKFDIVTIPAVNNVTKYIKHAMDVLADGRKAAFLIDLNILEDGKQLQTFKKFPPKAAYVAIKKPTVNYHNGKDKVKAEGKFAWFVWEKGYEGNTTIDWLEK